MPLYIIRTDAYIEIEAESKDAALDLACEAPNSEWELGEEWSRSLTIIWKGDE